MNIRRVYRLLAPVVLALSLFATVPHAQAATPAASSTGIAKSIQLDMAVTGLSEKDDIGVNYWQYAGWYPDPVACNLFGILSGRPYQCVFVLPWVWDLYIWV